MIIKNSPELTSSDQIVLFSFDDFSLPFQNGLRLFLIPHKSPVSKTIIVVPKGPPGTPDCMAVAYYGTVRKVGDEFWMWYLGQGDDDHWHQRVCLAKSRDGYNWEKPNLGLIEYNGSKDNNLVDMLGGEHSIVACVVFYEPEDPNPARRFKAIIETKNRPELFGVMFSEDGLRWKEFDVQSTNLPACEPSGGMKFKGCYYLTAHGGSHFGAPRQLVTFASYDFEHWIEASCLGLRRDNIPPRPMVEGFAEGEQVHIGAGLWNRGNVIIGLYGQWHGPVNNDRRHVEMDLGLVISNDALHYKEPIPDFRMVAAAEDGFNHMPKPWFFKHPALAQGQGFENIGDETLFWYAPWPEQPSDGVRVAKWQRDRLGYLQAYDPRQLKTPDGCHLISAPIDLEGGGGKVSLNIDGLSEHAGVTVEIQDEQFKPMDGYSRQDCLPLESGFKQPVEWKKNKVVKTNGSFRIQLNYVGIRPEDPKLYALYVDSE